MKRFNRLTALWGAFYSRDLYRQAAFEWKGIGALYLLLLLAICWVPTAGRIGSSARDADSQDTMQVVRQLPTVIIEGGVMRSDPPGRRAIPIESDSESGTDLLIVIDDSIERVPDDITEEALVLTKHEAGMIRPSRSERRIWRLPPTLTMTVTQDDVLRWLRTFAAALAPVVYVSAVIGSLIFRLVQALVYGSIATWMARRRGLALELSAGMRIAVLAVTPVVFLQTALGIVSMVPAWYIWWPIAIGIAIGYVDYGVRACAQVPSTPAEA